MEEELLGKLSDLTFYGFYDPSKDMITVHFFNEGNKKSDIIAYLKHDMSWDVREITNENAELYDDREVITISHNPVCVEPKDSKFDEFVRLGLYKLAEEVHGEGADLPTIDRMFEVLDAGSY